MDTKREVQLADLEAAYDAFVNTARDLSPEAFLASLGDWTPRDILAHFIGWNRITLVGCRELQEGKQPFYFYDGTNDYRKVNAGFFSQYTSKDREVLLREMATSMDMLVSYLEAVAEQIDHVCQVAGNARHAGIGLNDRIVDNADAWQYTLLYLNTHGRNSNVHQREQGAYPLSL